MPQVPDFLVTYMIAGEAMILAVLVGGIGLAVGRTSLSSSARARVWGTLILTLLIWAGAAFYLGRQGFFAAVEGGHPVPTIPFAIVPPIVAGLWLLTRSATIAELIDATPLSWLVGIQFYRVLGIMFLILWAQDLLPGEFALPAGIGDVLVGLLAIVVAAMAARGATSTRSAAYAWNLFGILDLVVAVTTGFLTSPGFFHLLAPGHANYLITAYPLVLVPAFAVPLSIILHGLSIWKLRREAPRSALVSSFMAA